MDDMTLGLIIMIAAAALLLMRMPIAFVMLIIGFFGVGMMQGFGTALSVLGNRAFSTNAGYGMSVVPMFVLMGHLAYAAGITQDIYSAARQWVGHLKGGLVIATILANAAFGAACGSTTAATAVFGRVAIPEMLRHGVDRRLAAGCVASSGSLSAIIPPSVLIVVYGILALESIPKLLIAGVIPGVLTALIFSLMVLIRATVNPRLAPPVTGISWKDRIKSLRGAWGVAVLATLILGGIYTGFFTPNEAGAVGALGAFLIVLSGKKLTRAVLRESFVESARTTAVIFIIVTGAMVFSMFLSLAGIAEAITTFALNLPVPPVVIVILCMAILMALGCVIDVMSMMFLTVPIMLPIIKKLGFDPIWFGILVVMNCEMGQVTPPVGLNCFMLKSVVPELSLNDIFQGCGWFVVMFCIALAFAIAFPQIVLFLPSTMYR